jgi:hypothetical protein
MILHKSYKNGVITFEEYHQKLMEKFDGILKRAEKKINKMDREGVCIK